MSPGSAVTANVSYRTVISPSGSASVVRPDTSTANPAPPSAADGRSPGGAGSAGGGGATGSTAGRVTANSISPAAINTASPTASGRSREDRGAAGVSGTGV